MIYYVALVLSIVLNAASLIMLKSFAVSSSTDSTGQSLFTRLVDARLITSVIAYVIAAVFWLAALVRVDLMVAYPSLALTYVAIGLIAPRLFSEELSSNRWFAIGLIIVGVVVMNVPS